MTAKVILKPTAQQSALADVNAFTRELVERELELAKAKTRLDAAIVAAVVAGCSQADVARTARLTRQRVWQIAKAPR